MSEGLEIEIAGDERSIRDQIDVRRAARYTGEVYFRVVMEDGRVLRVGVVAGFVEWLWSRKNQHRPPRVARVNLRRDGGGLVEELEP